jgi:hypothetical protein
MSIVLSILKDPNIVHFGCLGCKVGLGLVG